MAEPERPSALEEARQAYRACQRANGGHCPDRVHAEVLVEALESEVARLEREVHKLKDHLERSGTVYHMPR
jgi:hypothetical protein